MMKKLLFLICVFLVMIFAGQAFGEQGALICGLGSDFPPFVSTDKSGKPTGFDVEVMKRIAQEIGMSITFRRTDWEGIIDDLNAGEIDVIASGMSITDERAEKANFSKPYWTTRQIMLVKEGGSLTAEEVMAGKKPIGVQKGSAAAQLLEKEVAQKGWHLDLRYFDSVALAVEGVLNGQIAALVIDEAAAKDVAGKKAVEVLGTFGLKDEKFGYAVRKSDSELLEKINTALTKLMASPFWGELTKKYKME